MSSEHVLELTDANFPQEVLQATTPVLVDFWAEWCMPCRMMGPVIDELAAEYAGRVKVGKVDTDSNRTTVLKYEIRSIPTLILFKEGQMVSKFVSLQQKADLRKALDVVLAG